jgi:uncharacterized NAD(P)/FAD-binding protein YdhS
MFGLVLRVITPNGADEYPITPRVVVAFEREFQTGLGRAFQSEQKAEHMFWLAWKASKDTRDFNSWLDGLIDVEIVEGRERPLPETP